MIQSVAKKIDVGLLYAYEAAFLKFCCSYCWWIRHRLLNLKKKLVRNIHIYDGRSLYWPHIFTLLMSFPNPPQQWNFNHLYICWKVSVYRVSQFSLYFLEVHLFFAAECNMFLSNEVLYIWTFIFMRFYLHELLYIAVLSLFFCHLSFWPAAIENIQNGYQILFKKINLLMNIFTTE